MKFLSHFIYLLIISETTEYTIVNLTMLLEDRLRNIHIDDEADPGEGEAANGPMSALPKALIITNLPCQIFEDPQKQVIDYILFG